MNKKLIQENILLVILTKKLKQMKNIDFQKPVKLINPQQGEDELIFKVVSFNEVNNRCYIEPYNLKNWNKRLLPQELVSVDDIENV